MASLSKHGFGKKENLDYAKVTGVIDKYDIVFLDNGEIAWIDENGNTIINTPRTQNSHTLNGVQLGCLRDGDVIPADLSIDELLALLSRRTVSEGDKSVPISSACAISAEDLKTLPIINGQLIFVHDKHRIALDYDGKRKFYNQIEELDTDNDRKELADPTIGRYYFVIETAILWTYRGDSWIPLTSPPQDILRIGSEFPEFGESQRLYIDTLRKEISIWDATTNQYIVVANKSSEITVEEIDALFQI